MTTPDDIEAIRPLTEEELAAQRSVAEMVAKTAPVERYRLKLDECYATDVLRLLATIDALSAPVTPEELTEYFERRFIGTRWQAEAHAAAFMRAYTILKKPPAEEK